MESRETLANQTASRVARESFGRLVAFLSARTGDIAAAEDALADALVRALETWPSQGVPANPEAWLLVAARRRRWDARKHDGVVQRAQPDLLRAAKEAEASFQAKDSCPDDRLRLLFVCAHPAIDADSHAPLMLQTVLGLDAVRIARAFAVEPAAMSQRLVRTKRKILQARIPFVLPEFGAGQARISAVLEAIYAAYGTGWDESGYGQKTDLTSEALYLGALIEDLSKGDPECLGLNALMGFCEARRDARRDRHGRYVPLSEQSPGLWRLPFIAAAEAKLKQAASHRRLGRFQLEAAIQSALSAPAYGNQVNWPAIELLYEGLVRQWPSIGALVGRAAVVGSQHGPAAGLRALSVVPAAQAAMYQPYWAAAAEFSARLGHRDRAIAAYERAASMSGDPAVRLWLEKQCGKLKTQ
jgi:RNA polymerase sigma-70 factor (ECF subfamily)